MAWAWEDPEWIASELARLDSSGSAGWASGVRVAYRMQLEARAAELGDAACLAEPRGQARPEPVKPGL
jgi:hypothetical protein